MEFRPMGQKLVHRIRSLMTEMGFTGECIIEVLDHNWKFNFYLLFYSLYFNHISSPPTPYNEKNDVV